MTENPVTQSVQAEQMFLAVVTLLAGKHVVLSEDEIDLLQSEVLTSAINIASGNPEFGTDETSSAYLNYCSFLLALYRRLDAHLEDRLVKIEILKGAMAQLFGQGIQEFIKGRFDVDHEHPKQAFEQMSRNFKSRGEQYFGNHFTYDEKWNGANEVTFGVSKCLFKNFFQKNDAPELTPLFCAMDSIWSQELNTGKYNVRFDRPTIMSLGDDKCRFRFRKD